MYENMEQYYQTSPNEHSMSGCMVSKLVADKF